MPATRGTAGFGALRHPAYRLYFAGMLLRGTAVWMQLVSLPWLAVEIRADPFEVGLVVGLQFLPTLLVAPFGGVIADRIDRGRVLVGTQLASALQGLGLFLVVTGAATLPVVALFAVSFGLITAIELPVRQAYLVALVPREDAGSAVSLHSAAWNTTRFAGPGIAGLVIATQGVALSFLLSGVVVLGVAASIVALERGRPERSRPPAAAGTGVLRSLAEGVRFAVADRSVRWALVLVTAGGAIGIQSFQTLAPLFVSDELGLGGGAYGVFMALWGGGAVVASYVVTATARGDRNRWLVGGAAGMAAALGAIAVTGTPQLAYLLVVLLGFAQISLAQTAMVTVQVAAPDELRGRVMGLYTTLFQGASPAGAFLAGWIAGAAGIRPALATCAIGLGAVALTAGIALRRPAPGGAAPGGRGRTRGDRWIDDEAAPAAR